MGPIQSHPGERNEGAYPKLKATTPPNCSPSNTFQFQISHPGKHCACRVLHLRSHLRAQLLAGAGHSFTNAVSVTSVSPDQDVTTLLPPTFCRVYHNKSPLRRKQGRTTSQTRAVLTRKEKKGKRQHRPETKRQLHKSKTPNHEESALEAVMEDEKSRVPECRDFQNKAARNPANGFT